MKKFGIALIALCVLSGWQSNSLKTTTTAFFRLRYERGVSAKEATNVGTLLEADYAKYRKIFDSPAGGRIDVTILGSQSRLQAESKLAGLEDGAFKNGKLFIASPSALRTEARLNSVVARLASRAALFGLKTCPQWLAECYAVGCGGDLARYGRPTRLNMVSFGDLSEDFSRAESAPDIREVYAKLAVTASFITDRYGEEKFQALLQKFRKGIAFEDAMESVFGEKIEAIEKAWVKALASAPR